jgi:hypothetical protein
MASQEEIKTLDGVALSLNLSTSKIRQVNWIELHLAVVEDMIEQQEGKKHLEIQPKEIQVYHFEIHQVRSFAKVENFI